MKSTLGRGKSGIVDFVSSRVTTLWQESCAQVYFFQFNSNNWDGCLKMSRISKAFTVGQFCSTAQLCASNNRLHQVASCIVKMIQPHFRFWFTNYYLRLKTLYKCISSMVDRWIFISTRIDKRFCSHNVVSKK